MATHRSKPVEIEAFQWTPETKGWDGTGWFAAEILAGRAYYQGGPEPYVTLVTANGEVRGNPGDWIIREPSGIGCYPCKPEVFALKYEPID